MLPHYIKGKYMTKTVCTKCGSLCESTPSPLLKAKKAQATSNIFGATSTQDIEARNVTFISREAARHYARKAGKSVKDLGSANSPRWYVAA